MRATVARREGRARLLQFCTRAGITNTAVLEALCARFGRVVFWDLFASVLSQEDKPVLLSKQPLPSPSLPMATVLEQLQVVPPPTAAVAPIPA